MTSSAPAATVAPRSARGSGAVTAASVIYEGGHLAVGGTHAHALVALQGLALRLQRRRHHHLRAVELRQVLVPAGGHRGAQAAEQVEGAVVLAGGTHQDLLR